MNKQSMLRTTLPLLVGLALGLAAPGAASAQESGPEVWARACGRCHRIQPPTKYDARHWEALVGHMSLQARLTTDEEDAVRVFLMGAGRKLAAAPSNDRTGDLGQLASLDDLSTVLGDINTEGEEIFKAQCVACHGKSGAGDGPASIAFDPRPADLSDPEVMDAVTDEQLLEILKNGKGLMPAFSALLDPDQLQLMVEYIRSLSKTP